LVNPLHDIVGTEGNELSGKRIVLGVTGSVSAYRAPDIARLLMRHGADVFAVMSDMAQQIIHQNLMEWATGNPVVTELTGKIEHVTFTTGPTKADLILIAPCTANTIGKIACGIDDTPITSYVSSALGEHLPIMIAPAMHRTMYQQPLVVENIRKLTELGVVFVQPEEEEEKAKLAPPEVILTSILQIFTPSDFDGKKVLITAGPTVEHIDPVRVITNPSSGKMGSAIAFEAHRRGAKVTIVHGPTSSPLPKEAKRIQVKTTKEMYDATISELQMAKYDLVIAAAAPADYAPVTQQKKIQTHNNPKLTLELQSTPKIIDEIKTRSPTTFLVVFRAQANLSRDELVSDGYKRLERAHADLIAVNDVGRDDIGFGSDYNELILIDSHGQSTLLEKAPKHLIARKLLDEVSRRLTA
jgi:phosphopantothenoylcysteine decarboxylase/phosphopantothenate--cysteine ligase